MYIIKAQKTSDNIKNILELAHTDLSNLKATLVAFPDEELFFNKLLEQYQSLSGNLRTYPRKLTPVLQMFWFCFRRFLISSSLLLQGHISESFALTSEAAEATAAAHKMAMNPEKIPKWMNQEKKLEQPFRRVLGQLFPPNDKLVFPELFDIYTLMSEYGRHPSFGSTLFFSDFSAMDSNNIVNFSYSDYDLEENLKRSLNYQIYVYFKFLSIFKAVFIKYLNEDWLKLFDSSVQDFDVYRKKLETVFKKAPELSS